MAGRCSGADRRRGGRKAGLARSLVGQAARPGRLRVPAPREALLVRIRSRRATASLCGARSSKPRPGRSGYSPDALRSFTTLVSMSCRSPGCSSPARPGAPRRAARARLHLTRHPPRRRGAARAPRGHRPARLPVRGDSPPRTRPQPPCGPDDRYRDRPARGAPLGGRDARDRRYRRLRAAPPGPWLAPVVGVALLVTLSGLRLLANKHRHGDLLYNTKVRRDLLLEAPAAAGRAGSPRDAGGVDPPVRRDVGAVLPQPRASHPSPSTRRRATRASSGSSSPQRPFRPRRRRPRSEPTSIAWLARRLRARRPAGAGRRRPRRYARLTPLESRNRADRARPVGGADGPVRADRGVRGAPGAALCLPLLAVAGAIAVDACLPERIRFMKERPALAPASPSTI